MCRAVNFSGDIMMRRFKGLLAGFAIAAFVFTGLVSTAEGQRRNERLVRDSIRSLNAQVDDLSVNLRSQLRSVSAGRQAQQDAQSTIDELRSAVQAFSDNVDQRRENRDDMQAIIDAAQQMESVVRSNSVGPRVEGIWSDVQRTIERLASNYGITPRWDGQSSSVSSNRNDDYNSGNTNKNYPSARPAISSALTGTYSLDAGRSERVSDVIGGTRVSGTQRQDLEAKLTAPDQIAISVRGNSVTLASSNASPITFAADGTERTEQDNGRTIRVKATLKGDELTVSSLGGETDYTVTFAAQGSQGLKVTRRITTEYLSETVFVDSVYSKSDQIAKLGIEDIDLSNETDTYSENGNYSSNDPGDRVGSNSPNPTLSKPRIGQFVVPNGMVLTGSLENEINTKVSQNNDRFKMTVQEPLEYRGAVIEGYISGVGRSGQVSGRSNITFNFERIKLRDGKEYDFSGNVQGIKDTQGKNVRVDNEGTAQGSSQTNETAKRGGIGAGLGALIGAIAGGGKGAILGAIIGGGAGAGSVIATGRDDVRLMPGSTVTIQASSPIRENVRTDN